MSGFTKLVPEIVQSSIWNESSDVRCVWIAMIATKDKDGNMRGNRLALARLANVPVESVDIALRKFQDPDPDSNNQENEGRRIEAIPGGWHIISHAVYRAKDYREHEAERKKLYREKKAMSVTCPGHVPDSSVSVYDSESESVKKGDARGKQFVPPHSSEVAEYCKAKGYKIDAVAFCAFYASKGWMVGKTKMKDWKAAVVGWERRNNQGKTDAGIGLTINE